MGFVKDFIKSEWSEVKGDLKYDLYKWGTITVGGAMVALGAYLTHKISWFPDWVPYLVAFILTMFAFMWSSKRLSRSTQTKQPPTTVQNVPGALVAPPPASVNFDAAAFFRQAYTSALTDEAEKNFRLAAQQHQPNEREGFLLRIMGIGTVAWVHDITWSTVFKSQLLMLLEMNRRGGLIPLADAKPYYDQAVIDFPQIYANYAFEQWIAYLKGETLIIHHASNMLEITVKGKDFLKYLTHWGRYPEARRG
jgi:hypothetical protein